MKESMREDVTSKNAKKEISKQWSHLTGTHSGAMELEIVMLVKYQVIYVQYNIKGTKCLSRNVFVTSSIKETTALKHQILRCVGQQQQHLFITKINKR